MDTSAFNFEASKSSFDDYAINFNYCDANHQNREWFIASVISRKERFAIANLHNQKFKTFLPVSQKPQGRGPSPARVLNPLFPGYVFVSFRLSDDRWQAVNGTRGVRRLLCGSGSTPTPVSRPIMDELFRRCPDGIWQAPLPGWQRGEPVDILAGAFAGIPARFDEMLSRDRVRVMLTWVNAEVPAVMSSDFVAAAR